MSKSEKLKFHQYLVVALVSLFLFSLFVILPRLEDFEKNRLTKTAIVNLKSANSEEQRQQAINQYLEATEYNLLSFRKNFAFNPERNSSQVQVCEFTEDLVDYWYLEYQQSPNGVVAVDSAGNSVTNSQIYLQASLAYAENCIEN